MTELSYEEQEKITKAYQKKDAKTLISLLDEKTAPHIFSGWWGDTALLPKLIDAAQKKKIEIDYESLARIAATVRNPEKNIETIIKKCPKEKLPDVLTAYITSGRNAEKAINRALKRDPELLKKHGGKLLYEAAYQGENATARFLLKNKVDLTYQGPDGTTAVHQLAKYDRSGLLSMAISQGADIHVADNNGMTPLHYSAANGHRNSTRILLENDANPHATTNDGNTPADLIRGNRGNAEGTRDVLEAYSSTSASQTRAGSTSSFLARNSTTITNQTDQQSYTPEKSSGRA